MFYYLPIMLLHPLSMDSVADEGHQAHLSQVPWRVIEYPCYGQSNASVAAVASWIGLKRTLGEIVVRLRRKQSLGLRSFSANNKTTTKWTKQHEGLRRSCCDIPLTSLFIIPSANGGSSSSSSSSFIHFSSSAEALSNCKRMDDLLVENTKLHHTHPGNYFGKPSELVGRDKRP